MKAITICQPYAHLICLPESDPRHKRVENRKWETDHRGPLLIHAGKSKGWLDLDDDGLRDESYDIPLVDMAFGAIVATAQLVECFRLGWMKMYVKELTMNGKDITRGLDYENHRVIPDRILQRYSWLANHEHVEGPYCWLLDDVRPLASPVACKGAQGLWNAAPEIVKQILEVTGTFYKANTG